MWVSKDEFEGGGVKCSSWRGRVRKRRPERGGRIKIHRIKVIQENLNFSFEARVEM